MRDECGISFWLFPGGDGKLGSVLWGEPSGATVTQNRPTTGVLSILGNGVLRLRLGHILPPLFSFVCRLLILTWQVQTPARTAHINKRELHLCFFYCFQHFLFCSLRNGDSDIVPLQYSWHPELLTTWLTWRCSNFVRCYCVGRNTSSHSHGAFHNDYETSKRKLQGELLCLSNVWLLLSSPPLWDFSHQTFACFLCWGCLIRRLMPSQPDLLSSPLSAVFLLN